MQASNAVFEERVQEYEKLWLSHYDEGVPRTFSDGDVTLKQLILDVVAAKPDEPHIIFEDQTWTYAESNQIACKLANAMLRLGVKRGQRVSLVLPNMPEMVFAFMACYKIGAIAVGINPRFTAAEIAQNMCDNKAEFALACSSALPLVEAARQKEGVVVGSIVVVPDEGKGGSVDVDCAWPELYRLIEDEDDAEPEADLDPDDYQVLSYTGGTTGVSKGCCYSNRMIYLHAKAWQYWFAPALKGRDIKILVSLPMTHAYSITCAVNLPIVSGGTAIIGRGPGIEEVLCDINTHEPNVWPSVPALITSLAYRTDIAETKVSSIDIILCGTAPLAESTLDRFKEVSSARLIEGYGLSESTSCVSFNPMGTQRPYAVGLPICNTDVLIVDVETGEQLVDTGELGEIIFRGPQMIHEYWQHPEETAQVMLDGWLRTGDIGFIDAEGFLHIHSRKKNMIIVGGFNVFPQDVDNVLAAHPDVYESVTVGAPHSRLGEVAVSFVAPCEGSGLSPAELDAYCRERLTGYKVPKMFVIIPEIPRTPISKPDVSKLKETARVLYVQKGV